MIAPGIALTTIHACTFCWSVWLSNFSPSLDLYPDVVWPPKVSVQPEVQERRQKMLAKPAKHIAPKRTITTPSDVSALPVPSYWRPKGKSWEIGP